MVSRARAYINWFSVGFRKQGFRVDSTAFPATRIVTPRQICTNTQSDGLCMLIRSTHVAGSVLVTCPPSSRFISHQSDRYAIYCSRLCGDCESCGVVHSLRCGPVATLLVSPGPREHSARSFAACMYNIGRTNPVSDCASELAPKGCSQDRGAATTGTKRGHVPIQCILWPSRLQVPNGRMKPQGLRV